jgi:hypothetical protein
LSRWNKTSVQAGFAKMWKRKLAGIIRRPPLWTRVNARATTC